MVRHSSSIILRLDKYPDAMVTSSSPSLLDSSLPTLANQTLCPHIPRVYCRWSHIQTPLDAAGAISNVRVPQRDTICIQEAYGYHHTTANTPDPCRTRKLSVVGTR
eukprot:1392707-Amorphochlora_amoeboformis.AAC.3